MGLYARGAGLGEIQSLKEIQLSMDDLRRLEKVTHTAVIQCAGNGRSFFDPKEIEKRNHCKEEYG